MSDDRVTEPFYARKSVPSELDRNPALLFLFLAGPVLAIGGTIGLFFAKAAAESAASDATFKNAISDALAGGSGNVAAVAPDYIWVWILGALAFVGLLMLVAAIAIRAAKN